MQDEKRKYLIIAVDDDEVILDMYKNGLIDFEVKTFNNPKEAERFIFSAEVAIDLILMDIMMPSLDGISFIKKIRSSEKLSHIPIIAVSGLSDAATVDDAMLFGATDYIIKPFDIAELSDRIKSVIRKYGSRGREVK